MHDKHNDSKNSVDVKLCRPTTMSAVNVYHSISPQCKKAVGEYFRTGNINENSIAYEHIHEYLTICSSIHGLFDLRNICVKKLFQNLSKRTMFEIFNLADEFDLSEVTVRCADEILDSINHVNLFPEFMSLSNSQMEAIVKSPQCKSKLCFRDALYQWWQFDIQNRSDVYDDLKHKVNNKLFPTSKKSSDGRSYLVTLSLCKKNNKNQFCPEAKVIDVLQEKEYSGSTKKTMEVDKGFAACCLQRDASEPPYIFLSGGIQKSCRKMLEFDVIMNKWRVCSNMKYSRYFHNMENVNDRVYVFGGKSGEKNVSQIEEFNRKKNSWTTVGNLKWNVHSAVSAVCGDCVYLFGGKLETRDNVSVIQVFDSKTKSVETVGYLPVECSGGRCITIGNHIYIFTEQCHCIKYCTGENESVLLNAQPDSRRGFGVYLSGTNICLIGGLDSQQNSPDCNLKYSVHEGTWTRFPHRSDKGQEIFGQCLVKIPNDIQYIPFS